MDNEFNTADHHPAPAPVAAPEAVPGHAQEALKLPEARDKTTQRIHEMADFSVSKYLGMPLLTNEIGRGRVTTTGATVPAAGAPAPAAAATPWDGSMGSVGSVFSVFSKEDRLMFGGIALMILGPLFFGAF